jgi:hypothetical protein
MDPLVDAHLQKQQELMILSRQVKMIDYHPML